MEAVKQGSATVALKSNTHAVLVALKRASSDLSSHQKKILPIDDHVGISIAGLTADARSISKWMRAECMNSRYAHDTPLPISRSDLRSAIIFISVQYCDDKKIFVLGSLETLATRCRFVPRGTAKGPMVWVCWWRDTMTRGHTSTRPAPAPTFMVFEYL